MSAPAKPGDGGAAWDGVPQHPERDGAHWVMLYGDTEPSVIMWTAKRRYWTDLGGAYPAAMYGGESVYLGPCALPSEVAALRASNAEMLAALRRLLALHIAHHNNPEHVAARAAVAKAVQS